MIDGGADGKPFQDKDPPSDHGPSRQNLVVFGLAVARPWCEADFCYGQQPRSSVPSRMAAARSVTAIRAADSRSAMGARAVKPSRYLARSSKRSASAKSAQWIRVWRAVICALV